VPSIGFLALLAVLLFSPISRVSAELLAAARLNAAFITVATVGGLGALFNLFVYAGIRCYNRTSVFIAFFSIFALAQMINAYSQRASRRLAPLIVSGFAGIVLIAVADQGQAAHSLTYRYDYDERASAILADAVSHIERLCATCSVYQLPDTPFPQDDVHDRMSPYDHGRAHVYSGTLHWSWPAFGRERTAFGQEVGRLSVPDMVAKLRSSFRFIWLDRFGYSDAMHSPEIGIANVLGPPVYVSPDARFAVYDMKSGVSR
jgi:phosphoglycerol transferase